MSKIITIGVIAKFHDDYRNFINPLPANHSDDFKFVHLRNTKDALGKSVDAFVRLERLPDDYGAIVNAVSRNKPRLITEEVLQHTEPKILKIFLEKKEA